MITHINGIPIDDYDFTPDPLPEGTMIAIDSPIPRNQTKRLKHYRLRTNLDNEAGRLLDKLAADAKMSRTAWIESIIHETAKQKGITKPT